MGFGLMSGGSKRLQVLYGKRLMGYIGGTKEWKVISTWEDRLHKGEH